MNPVLSQCPVCETELAVTRLHCGECETTIDGRFALGPFAGLSADQMHFVAAFVRCEGKLSHLESELGMSYPTLRSRLHEVIRTMGHEPRGKAEQQQSADAATARAEILESLEAGRIDADEAMEKLSQIGG